MARKLKNRLSAKGQEFVAGQYGYLKWMMREFLSKGLVRFATKKLGSAEDVFQFLAFEFCRIMASLGENGPVIGKVPRFVAEQLAGKLKLKSNLIRDSKDLVSNPRNTDGDATFNSSRLNPMGENPFDPADKRKYEPDELASQKDQIEKIIKLLDLAEEPTRSMAYRFLVNDETFREIARDYEVCESTVGQRVKKWIKSAIVILKEQ